MNTEELIERLAGWCDAYPESVFPPLEGNSRAQTGDYDTQEKRNLITRNSAAMGRHMIERAIKPALVALRAQEALIGEYQHTILEAGKFAGKQALELSRLETLLAAKDADK